MVHLHGRHVLKELERIHRDMRSLGGFPQLLQLYSFPHLPVLLSQEVMLCVEETQRISPRISGLAYVFWRCGFPRKRNVAS